MLTGIPISKARRTYIKAHTGWATVYFRHETWHDQGLTLGGGGVASNMGTDVVEYSIMKMEFQFCLI